ncbi:MAG: hypothetical protein QOH61_1319 [Chloroflexota bacterium]|jgi:pimeloyl-ACP methyl ester carboxylesterase|nr:hypothetical protein [Chloroflexota bacterium]
MTHLRGRLPSPSLLGLLLVLAAFLVAGCSTSVTPQESGPQPTPVHTDREPAPGETVQPTATALPTPPASSAPSGAATPPGGTAGPTASPAAPSATPQPVETPAPTPSPTPQPTLPPPSPGPIAVAEKPCPKAVAASWSCVTLTVPLDHFQDTGRTADVTFALKRHTAPGPAKGTWVTITGGPGTAGIYSAVGYADSFDPSIRRAYDLVFMDQRGSGMSGSFTCPNAALAYYTDPAGPDDSGGTALKEAAQTFVDTCLTESKVDRTALPYYATRQAAEDVEAFRLWLGVDNLSLYGESYGTQLVQTYAAAHPDRVRALFLDGAVDLSTSGEAFYTEGARAYDNALVATLVDCSVQTACSSDVSGGNELTAYDELAAQLSAGPLSYMFTKKDGTQEPRDYALVDLQNAAFAVSSEGDRALLQRAVAAASRGDLWWLSRFTYGQLGQDPDTLAAVPDPSYADALYYAVECVDYAYFPDAGGPDERADAYLAYGRDHGIDAGRLAADFYGDLPCTYWPVQPGADPRPVPAADAPYPLVVLGATLDPSTPFQNAERIVSRRLADTWLIYKPGGPHVIYGRGDPCPDDLVTAILVQERFPDGRKTVCAGDVAADYVPLPAHAIALTDGTLAALGQIDDEIVNGVDYQYWDGAEPLAYGCPFGGTISYTPFDNGSRLRLEGCAFSEGGAASGKGVINDANGTLTLRLAFEGAVSGTVSYQRDEAGRRTVSGRLSAR